MSQTAKSLVKLFFVEIDSSNAKWRCKCGKELIQKKGTSWTNLHNHIKSQHVEYQQIQKKLCTMDSFINVDDRTKKGSNIYGWLNWVCCDLRPFNFVENDLTRLYTNLSPISENSLKKYLEATTKTVEKIICDLLPLKFSIILDGWSKNSTHFVGIFASYNKNNSVGYETVLLAFSPMLIETSFTAKDHYDFLECILKIYGKSLNNVVAIIGDNAEVNKAFANLCNLPLVGCASHRFNLAVIDFLKNYQNLIDKVNSLMGKLKNLKLSGMLRKFTYLRPVQKNITRWSSVADMFDRYERLKPILSESAFTNEKTLVDYFPTARENNEITELNRHLKKLNSVTIALQKENITFADTRYLFDEITKVYPSLHKYLSAESGIIHSKFFENGLLKIQENRINKMNDDERNAVLELKLCTIDVNIEPDFSVENEDFAFLALKKKKFEKESNCAIYMETRFIVPTSNIVERLFSSAGYAFGHLRQSLSPLNLEMQIFLKANKHLWDIKLVSEIVSSYSF